VVRPPPPTTYPTERAYQSHTIPPTFVMDAQTINQTFDLLPLCGPLKCSEPHL
jgi:hypothetical protein